MSDYELIISFREFYGMFQELLRRIQTLHIE